MESHLFILLIFIGVVPLVLSVSREYYLIQEGKTWSDAQAFCRANMNDLAIVKTIEDLVKLQNVAQKYQFSSSAWIGLYNNSWTWSMGSEPLGIMRAWALNQPDNWLGNEACVAIKPVGWLDGSCDEKYPFVCYTVTGNQKYIYISERMTWHDAQNYCRLYYTDLASARNAKENSAISGLISDYTWIGLFRDTWKWIDQTDFSTISWMSGQPDNALGNENCGYLSNSQAADARCSDIMPFFCYSEDRASRLRFGPVRM